jgi:hypothetical protein
MVNSHYPGLWFGRGGVCARQSRSPDLTLLESVWLFSQDKLSFPPLLTKFGVVENMIRDSGADVTTRLSCVCRVRRGRHGNQMATGNKCDVSCYIVMV